MFAQTPVFATLLITFNQKAANPASAQGHHESMTLVTGKCLEILCLAALFVKRNIHLF
jgi:hypothetical protein